jgi:hypothetical protein
MANADGKVLPKPGIPKTLGILNVIFGVLLVLMGFCTIAGLAAAPVLFQGIEKVAKETQAKQQAQAKANEKAIDDQIAAAKTDEEKKALEQQKANLPPQININPMDMSAATEVMADPTIKAVNFGGAISGLACHVLLLISGIGLIRLTPWGRTLGLWWGGLMIVQVLALLAATIFVVVPANKPHIDKQMANLEAQVKAQGGGSAEAATLQMTKVMASLAVPMAIGQALAGMIYPVVLLILLQNPGARAACLAKKPESLDGF